MEFSLITFFSLEKLNYSRFCLKHEKRIQNRMVTIFTMIFQFIFIQILRSKIQSRFLMFRNVILEPIMNLSNVSWSQVENWGLVKDLLGLLGVLNLIESVKRVIRKNLAWLTLEIYQENWSLGVWYFITFKGSSDPNHFVFDINVGKKRIRRTTTLKLNDELRDRVHID